MRKINLLMILLMMVGIVACAQKANAPEKIKTTFATMFPKVNSVEWSKESENEWEAEFTMNGIEMSANFDADGNWMETEKELEKDQLPESVNAALQSNFGGYKIVEASWLETNDMKGYEVLLKNGREKFEVIFDPEGKIIKEEGEDNEGNEDKED